MSNDLIADCFTRIRNGLSAGLSSVDVKCSKVSKAVLDVLVSEGFIQSYEACDNDRFLSVSLKYFSNGKPYISEIKRVSKSGRRVYAKKTKFPVVRSGLGILIISCSKGIVSDRAAKKIGSGGEILGLVC